MEIPDSLIGSVVVDRGQILLSDIFEDIDHKKFFVIIGVTEDEVAGFFYINSGINRFVNSKPEQLLMQYPLYCRDYRFLSHDSYICATNIEKRPKAEIVGSIIAGRTRIIDNLKAEHLTELLGKVRGSRLFSPIEKREFCY